MRIVDDFYVLEDLNIMWQGFARQLIAVTPPIDLDGFSHSKILAIHMIHGLLLKV